MLPSGQSYRLTITRIDPRGAWLDADGEPVLLPHRELPGGLTTGDRIEVFLFADKEGQQLASTQQALARAGEFAQLQVKTVSPQGAFLDWGLDKDLFVPFSEQPQKMVEGRRYLVRVHLDQSNRPIASARLEKFIEKSPVGLNEGDEVELILWTFTDLGAKVIVNHRFEGLLYQDDLPSGVKRGGSLKGYIKRLREDGKIDISLRRPGVAGVNDAREVILAALEPSGFLPLHDQSPPELIRSRLGLSKKVFKKALGGLYKEGRVELTHKGVRLLT